jgi:hypothetical protein
MSVTRTEAHNIFSKWKLTAVSKAPISDFWLSQMIYKLIFLSYHNPDKIFKTIQTEIITSIVNSTRTEYWLICQLNKHLVPWKMDRRLPSIVSTASCPPQDFSLCACVPKKTNFVYTVSWTAPKYFTNIQKCFLKLLDCFIYMWAPPWEPPTCYPGNAQQSVPWQLITWIRSVITASVPHQKIPH